jgi:hypothetical protein
VSSTRPRRIFALGGVGSAGRFALRAAPMFPS